MEQILNWSDKYKLKPMVVINDKSVKSLNKWAKEFTGKTLMFREVTSQKIPFTYNHIIAPNQINFNPTYPLLEVEMALFTPAVVNSAKCIDAWCEHRGIHFNDFTELDWSAMSMECLYLDVVTAIKWSYQQGNVDLLTDIAHYIYLQSNSYNLVGSTENNIIRSKVIKTSEVQAIFQEMDINLVMLDVMADDWFNYTKKAIEAGH